VQGLFLVFFRLQSVLSGAKFSHTIQQDEETMGCKMCGRVESRLTWIGKTIKDTGRCPEGQCIKVAEKPTGEISGTVEWIESGKVFQEGRDDQGTMWRRSAPHGTFSVNHGAEGFGDELRCRITTHKLPFCEWWKV
jgi:hypothetical protein